MSIRGAGTGVPGNGGVPGGGEGPPLAPAPPPRPSLRSCARRTAAQPCVKADTAQLQDASHDLTSMQTNAISCTVNLVSLTQTCPLSLLYHFQYVSKHALKALTSQYFVHLSLYEQSEAQTHACLSHNSMKNLHMCVCFRADSFTQAGGVMPNMYSHLLRKIVNSVSRS